VDKGNITLHLIKSFSADTYSCKIDWRLVLLNVLHVLQSTIIRLITNVSKTKKTFVPQPQVEIRKKQFP